MQVLFIDDDYEDFEVFCEALKTANPKAECLYQPDGAAGLNFLRQSKRLPNYIFLDINMPKMGGLECLKKIKSDERIKEIPVIIFSTSKDDQQGTDYKKHGAMDYIVKPYTVRELIKILRRLN